ncbi:hypothetical protein VD0002_g6332 [Verticillium dahliae]|nr:hypothetical protein VdG2_07903 [Verticillium dahliae VDG2]KAF3353327.1 hypothetical protein VdG1_08464 [Verticillium dahliae VDG1]PNH33597.1 hypothetical protein BJF96_g3120 [Verticillium dahliae]PNH39652.1 hypothetical protein VD0004_g7264 [Verticillium dahliae]PNH54752.1 hypothetical protein VD0003_g2772 [Verticillium dahliae]
MRQTKYGDADLKHWQCKNNIESRDQDPVCCDRWNPIHNSVCDNDACMCPRKAGSLAMGNDESVGRQGAIGKYTSRDTIEYDEIRR